MKPALKPEERKLPMLGTIGNSSAVSEDSYHDIFRSRRLNSRSTASRMRSARNTRTPDE